MVRNKILSVFLIGFMLFGCVGPQPKSSNNKFLAPTSMIPFGQVSPAVMGNYLSEIISTTKGADLNKKARFILNNFFPDGKIIDKFPYKHALAGVKCDLFGEKYVVVVSTKPLDDMAPFYMVSGAKLGVSFVKQGDFNTNIKFTGSSNQVSKVRISRPLVYKDDAVEKFSYAIPANEVDREVTKFMIAVQKAKDIMADNDVVINQEFLDDFARDVVLATEEGTSVEGTKHYKNVYSVMLDVFNKQKENFSEEDMANMNEFIHLIANSFSNIYVSTAELEKEIHHCNSMFRDKKLFFENIAKDYPEYMSMPYMLDEVKNKVIENMKKYKFTFAYALYCTYKHSFLVDDPSFAIKLDAVKQAMPHVMKDLELTVDYMIARSSKFIGSLKPVEISQELRQSEYAKCSRVIDKITNTVVDSIQDANIGQEGIEKTFNFLEHVRMQLTQVLNYGYKGAYLAGIEVENHIDGLYEVRDDLEKEGVGEEAIADLERIITFIEGLGHKIISDILEETEFSFEIPEEGFILFVDDMDAYVFNKFLEKYDNTKIRGIVAKKGTSTSHWVITAGQKDIPVILGASQIYGAPQKDIFNAAESSDYVGIDGNTGALVTNLSGEKLKRWIENKNWSDSVSEYFNERVALDTEIPLTISGNFDADLNLSAISEFEIERALRLAVDPIFKKFNIDKLGLVRSEYLYMMDRMLTDKEMLSFYKYMSSADKVITIRGFDYEHDKDISAVDSLYKERGEEKPDNLFGAKYYYQDPSGIGRELIKQQLTNVYKAYLLKPESKLRFMFPMVSSKEDINAVMDIKDEVLSELSQDGKFRAEILVKYKKMISDDNEIKEQYLAKYGVDAASADELELFRKELLTKYNFDDISAKKLKDLAGNMQIGSMVETGLAVRNIDKINKVFDFTSIGTNDLTKSTFDVSRDDPNAQEYFNKLQPDLLLQIRDIFASAVKNKKQVSVCGELAKDPKFMLFVLAESLNYDNPNETFFPYIGLSMSGVSIPQAKEILRTLSSNDLKGELVEVFSNLDDVDANTLDSQSKDLFGKIKDIISSREEVKELEYTIKNNFFVRHPDLSHFIGSHRTADAFLKAA